jgi:hypothetical protein
MKNPHEGIQELRYIDAMKMRYIRQQKKKPNDQTRLANINKGSDNPMEYEFPEIEEYFMYNPKSSYPTASPATAGGGGQTGIKFSKDSITYCSSGLVDRNKGSTLSYLHKAIKSLNQLRMIEDSLVIYRLSRAPERRIFYIDVGNLPKVKAEQYLRDVMNRYRNKLVYNAQTGQNLGEITDIEYFKKKLYKSLNVPISRIEGDGGFNLGRSSEILRDEVKFSKFVGRLRKRFSGMFNDMLKTQLLLKNICTPEDWEVMSEHIQYDFLYDNHFAELKEAELMNERLTLVQTAETYVGKYYSQDYIRRKVLRQTDEEILEQDRLIEKEIKAGIIPDPAEMQIDPATGQPIPGAVGGGDLGAPVMEPEVDGSATEAPELPKGGEI